MCYIVNRAAQPPDLAGGFDSPGWSAAPAMPIACVRPEGSDHVPEAALKLQYDATGIYGIFQVRDRYVRCVATKWNDPVCCDSCVEFFVQPAGGTGYNNFEINACGTMLAMHVDNSRRDQRGLAQARFLTEQEREGIRVFHTMPDSLPEELPGPVEYRVGFFLPFSLFRRTNHAPVPVKGTVWHANAYKCGDQTSHPHWLSWRPVSRLNFHLPDCFGQLIFD